jgi:ribosomal protein S18 acetylase RimI-like enzyme
VPTIARAGADALDALEPLWLELHHHHQAVGGERLGPYVTDGESWPLRRKLYTEVLENGGFLLLAHGDDGAPAGYAVVAITDAADSLLGDTWRTGPRVAEIETLLVHTDARGAGLGSGLLDRIDAELAAEGVADVFIGAVLTNTDAIRLYERRGFRPAWVYMLRLADAPPEPQ